MLSAEYDLCALKCAFPPPCLLNGGVVEGAEGEGMRGGGSGSRRRSIKWRTKRGAAVKNDWNRTENAENAVKLRGGDTEGDAPAR